MLPAAWIDDLFARLSVRYGSAWAAKWRDLNVAAVKTDWARELAGFKNRPDAITYALENLPPMPPNVTEFRTIARRAPVPTAPRLEAPKASPEVMREYVSRALAKLAPTKRDGRDWTRRIMARVERGERVNPTTYRFAREAFKVKESAE